MQCQSVARTFRDCIDSAPADTEVVCGKAKASRSVLGMEVPRRASARTIVATNKTSFADRTAAPLIDEFSAAFRASGLSQALSRFTHPALLVIDEVGYLTDGANMLFAVVNDRYLHRRSMIFTRNKYPTQWGLVLHDEDLALAIVDRILERGRLMHLDAPSIRTRHLVLDQPAPSALP